MGARPLRRVIQEQIEDKLADYVLDHDEKHNLEAELIDDAIVIKAASEPTTATATQDQSETTVES